MMKCNEDGRSIPKEYTMVGKLQTHFLNRGEGNNI